MLYPPCITEPLKRVPSREKQVQSQKCSCIVVLTFTYATTSHTVISFKDTVALIANKFSLIIL